MTQILCSNWLPERSREARVCARDFVFTLGISRVGPASESSVFGRIINTSLTTLVW